MLNSAWIVAASAADADVLPSQKHRDDLTSTFRGSCNRLRICLTWLERFEASDRATRQAGLRVTAVGGDGDRSVLSVEGEVIDPPDGRQLYDAICKQVRDGACAVSLDLAGTKLLGAAGITALIRAQADASRLGCEVTVVAASHVVRRVLEVTLVAGPLGLPEQ